MSEFQTGGGYAPGAPEQAKGTRPPQGEPVARRLQDVSSEAGRVAREAQERARGVGNELYQRSAQVRRLAAQGLSWAANALRGSSPGSDTTARRFADNLEQGATYLRQTDLSGMHRDLRKVIGEHPVQALGAAFVVGLLVGRRISRRRSQARHANPRTVTPQPSTSVRGACRRSAACAC